MKHGWQDILLISGVCVLLAVSVMLILSRMGTQVQEDMKIKCDALHGDLQFYECMSSSDIFLQAQDRCSGKVAGYVCVLSNGSEVEFAYDVLAGEVRP